MRVRIRRDVDLDVPAAVAWDYVTDWPRQGDWIPLTRVETDGAADATGGRLRARTGLGRVGFWDTMTITSWDRSEDGGGYCEVLHTGKVVRGEGEFIVEATGPRTSRFVWSELATLPLGRLGGLGWRAARPLVESMIDRALESLRAEVRRTPY